jgi:hypothetical protein
VPFAPFGLGTVSRQLSPGLQQYLYDLSRADGADRTRFDDTHATADASRNGEPYGEIGLVNQGDKQWWGAQTGGPSDPQPGNIPGGPRDVLRSADFNTGNQPTGFFTDSGAFTVSNGTLNVTAASTTGDAASVFYSDVYLPVYFELAASVLTQKPTAGWKANAFAIFDYQSKTDFKFAGIDISINKIVMGHRTAAGWIYDVQTPAQLKPDTWYQMLIAVNGTTVTVSVDGTQEFTYTFAPRMIDGLPVGLNKGLVGMGSNQGRGQYDNVRLQQLMPQFTLDVTQPFTDGTATPFTGPTAGTWTASGGRYTSSPAAGVSAYRIVDLGLGHGLTYTAYLNLQATL